MVFASSRVWRGHSQPSSSPYGSNAPLTYIGPSYAALRAAMIDIHHHLLPGLDDGATDMDTSIAMARLAVADGITHVVCTPHANDLYEFDPAVNAEKLAALRARLEAEEISLTLGLGCDLHLSYENIQAARTDPARFSINRLG